MERGISAISYQLSAISAQRASLNFSTALRVSVLRLLRLKSVLVISVMLACSIQTHAQEIFATTPDDPFYSGTSTCTGGFFVCSQYHPPYAELHTNSPIDNYVTHYVNSGSFKDETPTGEWHTWVTDFDRNSNSSTNPADRVINHFQPGTFAISGVLNEDYEEDEFVWDPDVIQMPESELLYSIFYSTTSGSHFEFPGNGSPLGYRVRLEQFDNTNPPTTSNNWEVQVNSSGNVLYAKNPNIDVSLNGDAALVWEEQSTTDANNHVYARIYQEPNNLSSAVFDLDPDDFDYLSFYNPDVSCAISDPQFDDMVFITFMGYKGDIGGLDLLAYEATVSDILTGATPSPANLYVLDNMPLDANLHLGNNLKDYFHRPRIAAFSNLNYPVVPSPITATPGQPNINYNVVVSEYGLNGTNINSYTRFGTSFVKTIHTQTPASSVDIDCAYNHEPSTEVNPEGYEVIWNHDPLGIQTWGSQDYLDTFDIINPICGAQPLFTEQTILRKRINWAGVSSYSDYSFVPEFHFCCFTNAPAASYDRGYFDGSSASFYSDIHYSFHHHPYFNEQQTYLKVTNYTNTSLKWSGDHAQTMSNDVENQSVLMRLGENRYQVTSQLSDAKLRLFSIEGKAVKVTMSKSSKNTYNLNLNNLRTGVYILSLTQNENTENHKLMVL